MQTKYQNALKQKLFNKTFDQQYQRFKRINQGDQIEKVAMSIAGKKTKKSMEIQGGSFYERLYMKSGRQRLVKSISPGKMRAA